MTVNWCSFQLIGVCAGLPYLHCLETASSFAKKPPFFLTILSSMRRGNLSRDKNTFSWKAEGGVRKTHRLSEKDIFVQVGISRDEFVLQRKGRPDQFLLIDSSDLERYIRKYQSSGIYLTIEAFQSLPHSLGELEHNINIVYPPNTRSPTADSTSRRSSASSSAGATSAGASPAGASSSAGASATGASSSAGATSAGPSVQELDDDDDVAPSTPPKGLYVWMSDNEVLLFNLLCDAQKMNQYLLQSVPDTCSNAQYNSLMHGQGCQPDERISKCVRRLLTRVHPDKLSPDLQKCGNSVFQKISEAYSELKQRPNFDPDRTCV